MGWILSIVGLLLRYQRVGPVKEYRSASTLSRFRLLAFLDKDSVGIWFLMLGAQASLGFFDLGFGQTVQRRIAYLKGTCGSSPDVELSNEIQQEIRDLISTARAVYWVISILVFATMLVGGWLYSLCLGLGLHGSDGVSIAWVIMSLVGI